jgi:hypothetical protein
MRTSTTNAAAIGLLVLPVVAMLVAVSLSPHHGREVQPPAAGAVLPSARAGGWTHADARQVGEAFLRAYVGYVYGRRSGNELAGASPRVRRTLRRVRVPPARAARTPSIVGFHGLTGPHSTVRVTAMIDDGDLVAYPLTAVVDRHGPVWVVTGVIDR